MIISVDELNRHVDHLFLSPHYDDIPLSCGGTVSLLTNCGQNPRVLLIFGEQPSKRSELSTFASDMHARWGMEAREVIAHRRNEEHQAAGILGYQVEYLPFVDAIYRDSSYLSDIELFGDVSFDDLELPTSVVEALPLSRLDQRETRIYAPLGIGNHVDHQIVFFSGLELANRGWEVWFYEDMPYALDSKNLEDRKVSSKDLVEKLGEIDISDNWDRKVSAILSYASQLEVIFGDFIQVDIEPTSIEEVLRAHSADPDLGKYTERYWRAMQP